MLLASAIDEDLQPFQEPGRLNDPRAVVMVPFRDRVTERLKEKFVEEMEQREMFVVVEDMLEGEDDWDNGGAVRCWLGIFARTGLREADDAMAKARGDRCL